MNPSIRTATTRDGVRIAYCVHGHGPPLVFVRGWISHIEHLWDDDAFRTYFETIGRHFTVVRYDTRGNGLSDRKAPRLDLDALVDDLETVADELALRDMTLYGQCFGGPIAIAYAARHPGRVARLILDGTYACGERITSPDQRRRLLTTLRDLPEAGLLLMSYYTTPRPRETRFRRLAGLPTAIEPEMAVRLYELGFAFDVSALLPHIHVPTLVLHRERSRSIPLRLGRELAALIPGAHFVTLPGVAHDPWEEHPAHALRAIGDFVGVELQLPAAEEAAHVPVTILFTDMEESTATTQRIGDAAAQELVRAHNDVVRDALRRHDGREIKHTGDGIMARFTSPSGAIECAIAVQSAFCGGDALLRVRVGINTGQPVEEEGDLFGTAVQVAKRICEHAQPGEILVSNVVRELCAGKGFLFADRGVAPLKGFDEPVRLFEVHWQAAAP